MTAQRPLPSAATTDAAPSHTFAAPRNCELAYDADAGVVHVLHVGGKRPNRRRCFCCGARNERWERERTPWVVYTKCGSWEE